MVLILNGVDFSRYAYRRGLAVQYEKRYGRNGGPTLAGTELVDLRAVKDLVTVAMNPLTAQRLSTLAAMCANAYVTAQYFSPRSNGIVVKEAIPTLSPARNTLTLEGATYWEGVTLTLKEK